MPHAPLHILIARQMYEAGYERLKALNHVRLVIAESMDDGPRFIDPKILGNAEILFADFAPENLDAMRNLKLIQVGSAGYEQLCGLNLPEKGVQACNGLGNFDIPIAEWNIAMMINLARNLREMIRIQERGKWESKNEFQREIRGSVVGFLGYGGIARETARLAKAMGMKVHALTRSGVRQRSDTYVVPGTGDPDGKLPDRVFLMNEKEEFLKSVDFLVMATPLTSASRGMMGESELRMLRPSAYVLNPSRGPLIDETALLRALNEEWIAGAALDTHYYYPMPPEHPLWKMPNVIMTPHISGSGGSPYYLSRLWDIFFQNVERYSAGKPLLNQLSSGQLNEGVAA